MCVCACALADEAFIDIDYMCVNHSFSVDVIHKHTIHWLSFGCEFALHFTVVHLALHNKWCWKCKTICLNGKLML